MPYSDMSLAQHSPQLWLVAWLHQTITHYCDVIMGAIASQITSLTIVYSSVYSGADQRKHQSPVSLAFVWGIHRDRWIPRTKGQLRGRCFHLMTSSCQTIIWSNIDFSIVGVLVIHLTAISKWQPELLICKMDEIQSQHQVWNNLSHRTVEWNSNFISHFTRLDTWSMRDQN